MYNCSKARQSLATLPEQAAREGEVGIERKDGRIVVIRPGPRKDSPLDVEGISLKISTDEVVRIIEKAVKRDLTRVSSWSSYMRGLIAGGRFRRVCV